MYARGRQMVTPQIKKGLIVGLLILLAVVALIGWERQTSVSPMPFNQPPAVGSTAPAQNYTAPPPVYTGDAGRPRRSFERHPAVAGEQDRIAEAPVPREVVKERPFSHSAAIVGGSA